MTANADGTAKGGFKLSPAEAEVGRCRKNVAAGELSQAAGHLGRALFHDPAHESAYAALGEVAEAAGSSEAARELFKGDGERVHPGNAAAIIALLAGEGLASEAVELLGSVVAVHPDKPWAAAPWFGPELADSLPPLSIGTAVAGIWPAVDNPAPPAAARVLRPWLVLARTAAARPDTDADCLCAFSALARRLEAYEDAVAWCRTAEEREMRSKGRATQPTLVMLGYALSEAGLPEQAIDAWKRAVAVGPGNADVLLELADITFDLGDFDHSLRWAERAAKTAAKTGGSELKYRAAVLAARYRASERAGEAGDIAPLTALVDLALAHPEESYVRNCLSRACAGTEAWLRTVPAPTEAVCGLFGELAEIENSGEGRVAGGKSSATALEAPTPTTILRARFPQMSLEVPHAPGPDPRLPVKTEFGPPLWNYRGTEASATVASPSPEAVDLVHRVARGMWSDPLVLFERAAAFAVLEPADLLGLLAHMPPPREPAWVAAQRELPLYWERFAQAWACVGILHHDPEEPWLSSTRRTLLLRLLFGPEDWTVDAAAFALCVSAWRHPEQRADIADAITERYLHTAEAALSRLAQLHDPLARVVLICPDIDPRAIRLARKALRRGAGGGGGRFRARWHGRGR